EPHVGDLIEVPELGHDQLADHLARDLLVEGLRALALDGVGEPLELGGGDRPLLAGAQEPAHDLVAVELDALPALLHDPERRAFDALVGRVAPRAVAALAPAPDREAVRARPRVDDPVVVGLAVRTAHRTL